MNLTPSTPLVGWPNSYRPQHTLWFWVGAVLGLAWLLLAVLGIGNAQLFAYFYHEGQYAQWALPLTHVADALVVSAILVWALYRLGLSTVLTALLLVAITGLVTQLLKHVVFDQWVRPPALLGGEYAFLPGTPRANSFPSGHSTTIFTWGACLLAVGIGGGRQLLLLALVFLVAFSRMWVGAHFPLDIVAGGGLALVLTYAGFPFLQRKLRPLDTKPWSSQVIRLLQILATLLGVGQLIHLNFF